MKRGQFRVIPEPPMSNRIPESDAEIAAKTADIASKLMLLNMEQTDMRAYVGGIELKDNGMLFDSDYLSLYSHKIDETRKLLKLKLRKLEDDYEASVEAYQEWLDAGKPDL